MRIAYVTQWFEPEPNIIKGIAFVQALQAAGHDVTVVTAFPNYPDGRLYPGYRLRPMQRESISGVQVVRLPLYPSHDRSSVRRSLNYLSFFISIFTYLAIRRGRFDLVYAYHPPITIGLAAALARVPFVLDVQDLWPDTIAATGMAGTSRLAGPIGAWCRYVYERASAIVAQSNGMARALIDRGVAGAKVSVIPNWSTSEVLESRKIAEMRDGFTIVYGGNIGRAQQLANVIEAAATVQRERPDIRIELYGSGVDEAELREKAHSEGLENLFFSGRVSAADMDEAFLNADALLLNLGDDPLFSITIPSKVQHYLALGRPIVAALNGEAAEIVKESGAAIVVPSGSPAALAHAILEMAATPAARRERMGRAGARFYAHHFSFSQGMNRTIALLESTYRSVDHKRGSR